MRLKDKVAIITGATSGIGRATAILFCEEGAKVVAVGRRADQGAETMNLVQEAGGKALFIQADVSQISQVKEVVDQTIESFHKIDILFNNAGVNPEPARKSIIDCPEEDWDQIMAVNLKGVFLASKYVIPHMIENQKGSVVNMASCYGHSGVKERCAYGTSKGGVIAMTKCMAMDFAPYNIRVNCLSPAIIETEIAKSLMNKARDDKQVWQQIITNRIPLDRPGQPEEVAQGVLYLASDESSWVTGINLKLDGGYGAQ